MGVYADDVNISTTQIPRSGDLTDYSGGIVVSPVGTNLGEILKPFVEGGPETGGYGYNTTSRMSSSIGNRTPQSKFNSVGGFLTTITNPIVLIGGGVLALTILMFRR